MGRYIFRRIAQSIVVVVGVVCVTFVVLRLVPGDPARVLLPLNAPPSAIAQLRSDLGLDRSLGAQFHSFIASLARGDLGSSFQYGRPVLGLVLHALPATLGLAAAAMLLACLVSVPLGILSAARAGSGFDRAVLVFSVGSQSVPSFWIGVLLVYEFAIRLGWFPAVGLGGVDSFVLPTITLAAGLVAILIRTIRQSMVEALGEDYVRTARAKGVPEWRILIVHAFRNASLPFITIIGLQVGFLLGGAFVIELIFIWPGVGLLALQAIQARDFPVVQGVVILTATVYVTVNLLIDILYAYVNPRVRLGMEG
jgi:ABC-type dipeptide/oligopeptide/nickel transport system permease component